MKLKNVCEMLARINLEITELERALLEKRKDVFGIPQDQISDFGDLWMAEETVHAQALSHNSRVKRLKFLRRNRQDLLDLEFQKTCSDCGETIDDKRLIANPSASRCIHCQEYHEKTMLNPFNYSEAA